MSSKRVAPPPRGKIAVRSDFRVGEFEIAIEQQGYRVLWEHASVCACRSNRHGGQPNFSCTVCYGEGYEYHSAQEIKAIVDMGDQQLMSPEGNMHKFHSAGLQYSRSTGPRSITATHSLTRSWSTVRLPRLPEEGTAL